MTQGFLYAAIGEKYISEAIRSVSSLKMIQPDANATLFTTECVIGSDFDNVEILSPESFSSGERNPLGYLKEGFTFKIHSILNSPYEKTFFVDTDTHFISSCVECFDLLDFYDLLIVTDTSDQTPIYTDAGYQLYGYYPYNTGIMVYNKSKSVIALIEEWLSVWKSKYHLYPQDQPALMEAMLHCPVNSYVLPVNYNFRLQFFVSVKGTVKLLHGRHDDMMGVSQKINATEVQRMWHYKHQRLIHNDRPKDWKGKVIKLFPTKLYQRYLNLRSYLRSGF